MNKPDKEPYICGHCRRQYGDVPGITCDCPLSVSHPVLYATTGFHELVSGVVWGACFEAKVREINHEVLVEARKETLEMIRATRPARGSSMGESLAT